MAIELNNLRVYALGLAHRAVSDISRDGFRQLRNYVDMCAFLAKTEDQQRFFDRAQTALEKTDSLYYPLIQRTLSTVSADRFSCRWLRLLVPGIAITCSLCASSQAMASWARV